MNRSHAISFSFAHSRIGRALLHLACPVRTGNHRWHVRGIFRELFGRTEVPGSSGAVAPEKPAKAGASDSISAGSGRACAWMLWLGLLMGGSLPIFAAPEVLTLDLLPAVQVDSTGIFLQQVVSTPPSANPPQQIRLADAPAFGRAASFSREQIHETLRRVAPGLAATAWSGAAQVRVTRRSRVLGEGELRELLAATLQAGSVKDKGELDLRLSRPWAPVTLPDETLALKIINLPASGVSPNFIVRFELAAGPERFGPWQVVAQARVMREVPVARSALKRGQPLQESDFIIESRDVLSLREPVDPSIVSDPAFELVENVSAGQPLLARSMRMRPVVQRGQFVDGLVLDGAMNISLKVEVLADGLPGQTVRVRNPKTKREFYAKVQDEQTVVINL